MKLVKKILVYLGAFLGAFALGLGANLWVTSLSADKVVWNETVGTEHLDIAYGEKESNKFDLYLPANQDRKSYGLVIYLHAGGFTTGDKSDDADILEGFVNRGYVAAGINYTLRTETNNASVFTMSQEIKEAIPQVIAEAKKLGYPVEEMVLAGGSAGGGLATLYAYRDGKDAPVPIRFVYALVPPTSFQPDGWYGLDKDLEQAAAFFTPITGVALTKEMMENGEYQEIAKAVEAFQWVDEDSPPSLIAFGKHDKVVPFTTTPYLIKAFEENNVANDVLVFEYSGHGLHRDKDMQKLLKEKLNEYFDRYMPLK